MRDRYKIMAGLLTGLLSGIIATLMYFGGSVSLSPFLQEGIVYDFSQSSLTASGKTWEYDEESRFYTLTSKKAIKRMVIDGKENSWSFLYLTLDRMSVQELPVELRYYNKDFEILFSQDVILVPGENVISLNPEIFPYGIGFCVKKQKGVTVSFSSMQIREKERREYAVDEFLAVTVAVFLLFLVLWALLGRVWRRHVEKHVFFLPGIPAEYIYYKFGRGVMGLAGGQKMRGKRRFLQTLIFSFLFFWCIFTNVTGWSRDQNMYRYQVLVCMLLLILAGGFCAGKERKEIRWDTPIAGFWAMFWVGTIISDFFAGGRFHFYGYAMLLAGGFFIYQWNRMHKPRQMFEIWSDALEIVFFLTVTFCLFFRPKLPLVQYNGVFLNPQENAMYALLMFVTFVVDTERQMKNGGKGIKVFLCFSGMALAVYMLLKAEDRMGCIAAWIFGIAFLIRIIIKHNVYIGWVIGNAALFAGAFFVSALVLTGFHFGIDAIPDLLGTSLEYKEEVKLSAESEEVLDEIAAVRPDYVKNIVTEADRPDVGMIRMAYVRELSLLGNRNEVRVSGKVVSSDNGYLFMAYHYGIFILVPFLMYQIAVLQAGISGILSAKRGGGEEVWIFGVMVSYIAFCVSGTVQLNFAHPLWICAFLGSGFWFVGDNIPGCIWSAKGKKKKMKKSRFL